MRNLGALLLIVAIILSGLVAYNVYQFLQENESSGLIQSIEYKKHYVAKVDIEENTLITKEMIQVIEVPEDFDTSLYITDQELIVNQYAYTDIKKGEGFIEDRLIDSKSAKMITTIEKGKRAVSIPVTQFSGVASLIKPSDYVDVYVFLPEKTVNNIIVREDISKLMLQKVRVLAIEQTLSRDFENEEEIPNQYAVTLELDPKDIEKVVLSESIGQFKLALRSIGDTSIVKTNGEVWRELLTEKDYYKEWLYLGGDNQKSMAGNITNPPSDYVEYTVRYGDTLKGIAVGFYGDESLYTIIKEANGIQNSNLILAGSVLKIPKLPE